MANKTSRAYTLLCVKSATDTGGERVITGMATTPTPDRYGDVVESKGATFASELPLLWQHDHSAPVGHASFGKPTKAGIPFTARIATIDEPGRLKDRLDEAWQSVKSGLVRAVSIGFSASKWEPMPSGGLRFLEWECLELSLVTIPANAEATIDVIRTYDMKARGLESSRGVVYSDVSTQAGVSAQPQPSIKENAKMTLKEQLAALRKSLEEKAARQSLLVQKSGESGETLAGDEATEFDGLTAEIESIQAQIKRVEILVQRNIETARAVSEEESAPTAAAKAATGARPAPRVELVSKAKHGSLVFANYVRHVVTNRGNLAMAERSLEVEAASTGDHRSLNMIKAAISFGGTRAAVAPGTTTDGTWVGALVGDEKAAVADFVEYLRDRTIVGRLPFAQMGFRTPWLEQTSGGEGYWVGESNPKPLTKFDFARKTLEPLKVANIAVLTKEAVRDSSPKADLLVRDGLIGALWERLDTDFLDPTKVAVTGISPASITNGVTPIPSSGTTAAAARTDLKNLFGQLIANKIPLSSATLVMNEATALSLSFMVNTNGEREFPEITPYGGSIAGVKVETSGYVPSDTSGHYVFLLIPSEIYVADEGGFEIDYSDQATLTMDSAPASNATATFSLWQRNCVGILGERTINWAKRRVGAVAVLSGVNWA